ncbi:MAG: ImmA/IrrE family metallo-endopeptidase [Alphaproteobacteria bacterium]|nr:ImmA/IrrE family metallo-endopeptidase [Alphaproteobacteria bacterium]MCY4230563.1 ImmA/IrrE family metallo-endopeptidase [Alphaproteobacteria bacterium]
MATIKPIRSERDYEAALGRISELMDAEPDSREGDELDILVDLVELYESKHVPMGYPNPIAAIEFRMEQAGLRPADLATFIGSRAKVSEVLSGKRAITMPMARALHEHLGIPADVLLQEPDVDLDDPWADMEWSRFPVKSMAKLGWLPDRPDLAGPAEDVMRGLINRAGGLDVAGAALYRKNDHVRANAKMDPYALRAWCWQILARANEDLPKAGYERGTVTLDFLTKVARLSWSEDGPRLAKELLVKRGISLVIEKHLPKTYLDGVALRLGDGRPVIGLTLRDDRIDNFWFCLLHELAHVGRHMDNDRGEAFVDDFTLRKLEGRREDPREMQADEWAEEALIPRSVWEASAVRDRPTTMAVMNLANALQVHPAIVAGRVRYERKNYRLLSQFVGTGEVRRQFGMGS